MDNKTEKAICALLEELGAKGERDKIIALLEGAPREIRIPFLNEKGKSLFNALGEAETILAAIKRGEKK